MRLLIVGALSEYAIERHFCRYCRQEGVVTDVFAAQDQFLCYYNRSLINKLSFRTGFSPIYSQINTALRKKIAEFRPDSILVFKGMEVFPSTLKWASNLGIKLANYNPDNPFLFSGRGSGNKNVSNSIPYFDAHVTYDQTIAKKLSETGKSKVVMLPFGFELSNDEYYECKKEKEINQLCFVGNPDKQRAAFLLHLAENNIRIAVYGNHWERFVSHKKIEVQPSVYGLEFWKTLRKYRIQLNLMRPHNPTSHNMRTFEIGGVGGIQLAPDSDDHRTFFEDRKEIFLYHDLADCVKKVALLLKMSAHDAATIRENARNRSILSGYTYQDRVKQLLPILVDN